MLVKFTLKNFQKNLVLKKNKIKSKIKKKVFLKLCFLFKQYNLILNRIKFRLFLYKKYFFFKGQSLKIYHNKKFFFNFHLLKIYLKKKKKEQKLIIYIKKGKIFLKRKLKKKKFFYLLNKKKFFKYNKYNKKYNAKNTNYILFDFYNKILLTTFRVGKKSKWNSILSNLFISLSFYLKYSINIIFLKIFIRLFTPVELRKVKSRKRISFIPLFIKPKRSIFLSLKWLFLGALKSLNNTSFQNKLYIEFIQLLTFKTCYSIQKLEENNMNSNKNRSNAHFRWQKTR